MKLMLVSHSDALVPQLERSFAFQQADVIHYANPIKAMDNLGEIQPEVVLFAATDFPRHWKPFVVFLRTTFARHESIFILLINETFTEDEADKAEWLDVNAIVDADFTSRRAIERIRGIVTRYHQAIDIRRALRYLPSRADRIGCAFTNPYTFRLVTGRVLDISSGGIRLEPDDQQAQRHLDEHTIVTAASLRLGDDLRPIGLRVIRAAETIAFEFADMTVETEKALADYLTMLSRREYEEVPAQS